MAGNSNLHISRAAKTDEFYTQLSTVEDELRHYREYFRGKVIFCNADDPAYGEDGYDHFGDGLGGYTSNFFRYFQLNFEKLEIKKLIATHYDPNKPTYKLELTERQDTNGEITRLDVVKTPLKQNGDFRSPECLELLHECDVIITNPPFSLMKEYLPLLVKSGKQFIVLGNTNHITLKEITGYFLNSQCWLGYVSGHFWFRVPDYYEIKDTDFKIDDSGQKWRRMGNCCWFTNIDIPKRHEKLDLFKKYSPEQYPVYDDFDAIECGTIKEIPLDYFGVIGVPITYMAYHCREQFEITDLVTPKFGGKLKYKRLFIKRVGNDAK
ncbi:MAG: adenine-specific methyltransferase EcoRI family protein [Spirochaetota bacterium]|jgi:hypothetical protein|nr:adenine-specific methyltransferase EcoRI family protein [Spirochaetota bacterium]